MTGVANELDNGMIPHSREQNRINQNPKTDVEGSRGFVLFDVAFLMSFASPPFGTFLMCILFLVLFTGHEYFV